MGQNTHADDDGTELKIDDGTGDITEIEARRIHEHTDYNVTTSDGGWDDKANIHVYWDEDLGDWGGDDVNSYHKASVINDVLDCPASVKLNSTDDGSRAVTFKAR